MRVDVFVTPQEIPLFYTKGRRVIIVDVLRAGTTLSHALQAGVDRIVPVETVEEAKVLLASLDRETCLLAGEQDGQKLDGFDLGNSPSEFRRAQLQGRTIVFACDDSGPLLSRSMEALEKLVLSFVDMEAVVEHIESGEEREITVICAGHQGRFAMEDALAAGMLLDRLGPRVPSAEWNDAARAVWILYRAQCDDLDQVVRESAQGRLLASRGAEADLDLATRVDSVPWVPVIRDGRIVPAVARS